jgi:Peptidase of plants and bacteria
MDQPRQTAQGNRPGQMAETSRCTHRIRPILRAFLLALGGALGALAAGCSAGESGLVLGKPLAEAEAGAAGAFGSLEAGGTDSIGGEPAGAGAPDSGAAGSMQTAPGDPPWIADLCRPIIHFENRDLTAQGKLFTDAVPDPSEPVWAASQAACRTLFHRASEVKQVADVSFVVEDYAGVASTAGNLVHLSTRYLKTQADRGVDLRLEITGILHFSLSLVYENQGADADAAPPDWLIVGIADYVRLESGYLDRADRVKGGSYDGNSQATAFFLDYLATKNSNIVYSLNQRLAPTAPVWNNDAFVSLMGSDLDTLWAEYQATL